MGQPTLEASAYTGLVMVAGGSAATVALQASEAVLSRHPNRGRVRVVLCNHTAQDVLLQERFEELLTRYPHFRILHCISAGPLPRRPKERARWRLGRVDAEALSEMETHLPTVVSGPPGLCQTLVTLLSQLGRDADKFTVLDELPAPLDAGSDGLQPLAYKSHVCGEVPLLVSDVDSDNAWRGHPRGVEIADRSDAMGGDGGMVPSTKSPGAAKQHTVDRKCCSRLWR